MPGPLRFVPAGSLVEITIRAIQGGLLLKPSPELSDIISSGLDLLESPSEA